jgi:hypothetical protein
LVAAALATLSVSCMSYTGVSKADGQLYVSGGMTYLFITVPFIKRCEIDGQILKCEELAEAPAPGARRGGEPGGAAPASSSTPAAPAAPAAPASPAKK